MKDDGESAGGGGGGGGDSDVLKVYVYGMLVVTLLVVAGIWWVERRTKQISASVRSAQSGLVEMADAKREVQGMLDVFDKNKEDEARVSPITWFTNIYRRKGIQESSIQLGQWKTPPVDIPEGNCLEERYEISIVNRAPLSRQQIVALVHEIERSSTRMRTIDMSIQRASNKDEDLEADLWTGKITVGYRHPKMNETAK